MPLLIPTQIPKSESELLERCQNIEGLSFYQLACELQRSIPLKNTQRKGWIGQAIEIALGASAGASAQPDFPHLGIELKTLPLNEKGQPSESTYVTSINFSALTDSKWEQSVCYKKLQHVLWVPIEGCQSIDYMDRRIGRAFLWSPTIKQEAIIKKDWEEHIETIVCGRLEELDARKGEFLQVRPKGANAKSLCLAFDEYGTKVQTLPRGFYLRALLTREIIKSAQQY